MAAFRARRPWLAWLGALTLAVAPSCSRTGFGELGVEDRTPTTIDVTGDTVSATVDGAVAAGGAATFPPDAAPTATASAPGTFIPPPLHEVPGCAPTEETCNGQDDDCNGKVDDGLPAIPCAGGGDQYCVAGRYSACPRRCETCIPGTERVCFLSYCTFWATETCAADGRGFGTCRERHVPPECEKVADRSKDSPELEQCCIDNGYCCHDEFDLDRDGNHDEMVGRCDEVSCAP